MIDSPNLRMDITDDPNRYKNNEFYQFKTNWYSDTDSEDFIPIEGEYNKTHKTFYHNALSCLGTILLYFEVNVPLAYNILNKAKLYSFWGYDEAYWTYLSLSYFYLQYLKDKFSKKYFIDALIFITIIELL